jgi:hypothetical protein
MTNASAGVMHRFRPAWPHTARTVAVVATAALGVLAADVRQQSVIDRLRGLVEFGRDHEFPVIEFPDAPVRRVHAIQRGVELPRPQQQRKVPGCATPRGEQFPVSGSHEHVQTPAPERRQRAGPGRAAAGDDRPPAIRPVHASGSRAHPRRPIRAGGSVAFIAVLAVAGFGLAACGGPSTPGVATGSTTSTTASSSPHGSTGATGLLAYSSCVRSHGVPNFPDPSSNGGIPKETAPQLGVSQSQLQVAQSHCTRLLPAGGSLSGTNNQTITVAQQQYYLKAAACMHSHGVTNFPEPSFFAGSVEFQGVGHLPGVSSSLFKHAFDICQKLIPEGLPYSSGSDG